MGSFLSSARGGLIDEFLFVGRTKYSHCATWWCLTSWEWRKPVTIIDRTPTALHPDVTEGGHRVQPMLYVLFLFTTTA